MVSCPSCEKDLKSEHGVKVHHATVHGESLVKEETTCNECGKGFEYYPSTKKGLYCSDCIEIIYEDKKKDKIESECPECGEIRKFKPFQYRKRKTDYCRSCYPQEDSDNPHWKGGKRTVDCCICGKGIEVVPAMLKYQDKFTCSQGCDSERRKEIYTGEGNPNWKGGHIGYYGDEWSASRREVRKRDGNVCQICGIDEEDLGFKPHVHHIKPVRSFDNPNNAHTMKNMIQLCPVCHNKAEHGKVKVPEVS